MNRNDKSIVSRPVDVKNHDEKDSRLVLPNTKGGRQLCFGVRQQQEGTGASREHDILRRSNQAEDENSSNRPPTASMPTFQELVEPAQKPSLQVMKPITIHSEVFSVENKEEKGNG